MASSASAPRFSITIAVYNDWTPLNRCLRSLAQQKNSPSFEVIIVDDGSRLEAPESIREWSRRLPLTLLRQRHAGIAAARNLAIRASNGSVLIITDADCKFQEDCLAALDGALNRAPEHGYFQLHLIGDCSGLVGRAEELRLRTTQQFSLQPDGCIRYLNTAGFAVRRSRVDATAGLFDATARRAEDTLLLANLIQQGELPLYVPKATVQHAISLSLTKCLFKDVRSGFLEGKVYRMIASKNVRIHMTHSERLRILALTWKASAQPSIGRMGWIVLVLRQLFERSVALAYRWAFSRTDLSVWRAI